MSNKKDHQNPGETAFAMQDARLNTRLFRTMVIAIVLAVLISIPFAPWRVQTGLLLGGLLSLLNLRWMRSSIAAGFNLALESSKPRIKLAQYVIRYFVIGLVLFAAYKLKLVSLPAAIAGLCAFVAALFVEAFRELYLAITQREEIS